MKVKGKNYRTIWMKGSSVFMIEQNLLPFEFKIFESKEYKTTCHAIITMIVRGAGAIGAAAGYAMAQAALLADAKKYKKEILKAKIEIEGTRPTARNLFYAVERVYAAALVSPLTAVAEAEAVANEDALASKKIGEYGNKLIKNNFNILTHCNAGWLAFVDYGTALSPIYTAHRSGKKVFVYVDETRPRSQGARLTAWELKNEKVPHVIVPDNAGAFLMSQKKVDMVIVGADRVANNGDVANKIGTFEKAIVANEFGIPFYVAAPTSTFDLKCKSGKDIPIEQRSENEVLYQTGINKKGEFQEILVCSPGSKAFNPAFDVTPAKYISGIITEKGIIKASEVAIIL
ncbi:MAG: S-methyl-5-thioribose-1-phosphate isomerase [Bacteroidota bacterium]